MSISLSLNALSGIGGVQTELYVRPYWDYYHVLMPCRALEAFRLSIPMGMANG